MKTLFYKFCSNIIKSFSGYKAGFHMMAIFLTYLIVRSGFDWVYFTETRNPLLQSFLFPAVILAPAAAIFLPITMLIIARIKKNLRIKNIGFALGQAAIIGWFISSLYKSFTGRVAPPLHDFVSAGSSVDISKVFHFGFMHEGIIWGWPSGHTSVSFAVAVTAFVLLYPKKKVISFIALILALYVGIGISTNIHWFSDFVAGVLVGTTVGITVGKSFSGIIDRKFATNNQKELDEF